MKRQVNIDALGIINLNSWIYFVQNEAQVEHLKQKLIQENHEKK